MAVIQDTGILVLVTQVTAIVGQEIQATSITEIIMWATSAETDKAIITDAYNIIHTSQAKYHNPQIFLIKD
jgi:hypothetical protein